MAKGKKTPTMATRTYVRKNHGPKRHLHRDIYPKALRNSMELAGAMTKYFDYDSFCVALQARNVRADYKLMWNKFSNLKIVDANGRITAAADEFFKDAANIGAELMREQKKK